MAHKLTIPEIGESIHEVQIAQWHKQEGQWSAKDEILLELETDKATVEMLAPVAGVVSRILKREGQTAEVGEVVGYLEEAPAPQPSAPLRRPEEPAAEAAPVASAPAILKQADVMLQTEQPGVPLPPEAQASRTGPIASQQYPDTLSRIEEPIVTGSPLGPSPVARQQQRVPMSPIRRRIADRLVAAQQTAALLTTFNEIDMSTVIELRHRYGEPYQERWHVKLGIMAFFVKAVIEGLKLCPKLNAEIQGADIVYRKYYDIGVAVGGGKGLVVPVLRNAEGTSFADIERAIADFATRARENKLKLEELEGGTFTITNGGVFGSLLSTPIVNPPQSGIFGMHAIQDRPVARDGQVVIRPMMYVALTYDHRLVDGREAVSFLQRVKEVVEDPARMFLEI